MSLRWTKKWMRPWLNRNSGPVIITLYSLKNVHAIRVRLRCHPGRSGLCGYCFVRVSDSAELCNMQSNNCLQCVRLRCNPETFYPFSTWFFLCTCNFHLHIWDEMSARGHWSVAAVRWGVFGDVIYEVKNGMDSSFFLLIILHWNIFLGNLNGGPSRTMSRQNIHCNQMNSNRITNSIQYSSQANPTAFEKIYT